MLRYGYRNVIALEGAHGSKVPETIIKLASRKTAILFVDGDRMGELIARDVCRIADIDYVAKAPPGKEVEELTGKEIAKALKNAIPAKQFLESIEKKLEAEAKVAPKVAEIEAKPIQPQQVGVQVGAAPPVEIQPTPTPVPQPQVAELHPPMGFEMPARVIEEGKKVIGTLEALLYDASWNVIEKLPVRDLVEKLQSMEPGKVQAIVFDGVITQRLLDTASEKGVKLILGVRIGNVTRKPEDIYVMTFQDIFGALS
jgi:DNA primase